MNPDVVHAIARLRADNVLSGDQATFFDRVARRMLVSVCFGFGGGGAGEKY